MSERVGRHAEAGPAAIDRRLAELDREWDAVRAVAVGSAAAVLAGLGLGVFVDRRLLALPAAAAGFLLLAGGARPRSLARRLGLRTAAEVGEEWAALKALRGDFHDLPRLTTAEDRADTARWEGEGGSVSGPGVEDAHDRHDRNAVDDAVRAAGR